MSPPKSNKSRASTAAPPLDFSKKLRIIRAPKSLRSLLTIEGVQQTDSKQTSKEYQNHVQRFNSQFPPLTRKVVIPQQQATKKTEIQPAQLSNDVTALDKPNIKVPEWKILTTQNARKGSKKRSSSLLSGEEGNELSGLMDQISYSNGHFYYDSDDKRLEVSTESVADLLMKESALAEASRVDFTRSGTYIRYSMNKDTSNTTKAFGKDCLYYVMRLDDYIFLLGLLRRSSIGWSKPLTWPLIRWLSSQLLQPRNLPSLESDNDPDKLARDPTILRISRRCPDGANASTYEEHRFVSAAASSSSIDGLTMNGVVAADGQGSIKDESSVGASSGLETTHFIPPALSSMSMSMMMNYRKMMGPYITDEIFAYLINLFELMSGFKECVQTEAAVAEARARLAPTARILREIIDYWKSRRAALGKPLLREFWPVPPANDNSPFAVFRARTKEKMVLRRPRRSAADSSTRFGRLAEDFLKTENLFAATRYRDWIKLQLCDIDALLFEQLWKEHQDPHYKHPGWNAMKRDIEQELRSSRATAEDAGGPMGTLPPEKKTRTFSTATTATTESTTATTSAFNVPIDIEGFGNDAIMKDEMNEDDGSISQRHSKRRRLSMPSADCPSLSKPSTSQQASDQQRVQSDMYYLGTSRKITRRHRQFIQSKPSDPPARERITTTSKSSPSESPKSSTHHGVFITPVPLPPVFLGLDPSCSKDELEEALRSVGVLSMTPIGVLDSTQTMISSNQHLQSYYYSDAVSQPSSCKMNFQCPSPPPTPSQLLSSPISQLPFPHEVFHLCRTSPIDPSTHPTQSYIYRQSLASLPPRVRHPSNLRYVIPYGHPGDHRLPLQQSNTSSLPIRNPPQPSLTHTPSCSSSDNLPSFGSLPMRTCIRIGRSGRAWLDRHPIMLPTPPLLSSPPVNLSSPHSLSTVNPFAKPLQSEARRVKSILQMRPTDGLSSPEISEMKRTAESLSDSGITPTLQCSNDSSLLIQSTSTSSSTNLPHYVPCFSSYGFTLQPIDHSIKFVSTLSSMSGGQYAGYTESGFYPTGIGGPEASLLGSALGDLQPGFSGSLGFDAPCNTAGFNLFCTPRQSLRNRQEFWEELFATRAPA